MEFAFCNVLQFKILRSARLRQMFVACGKKYDYKKDEKKKMQPCLILRAHFQRNYSDDE